MPVCACGDVYVNENGASVRTHYVIYTEINCNPGDINLL